MIQADFVREMVETYLADTDCQLVTLSVSPQNSILVEVDSYKGVDVDFCAALSRYLQERLDRDTDDYELEVGSVSLTDPFKTRMQYEKNVGNNVEVLAADGKKYRGVLVEVNDDTFAINMEEFVLPEGAKRKRKEIVTKRFAYADVKSVRYDLKV